MKKTKLSSNSALDIPDYNHDRHRRRAYYHGKYHRQMTTTFIMILAVVMFLYKVSG